MQPSDNLYSPHTEEALIGSCILQPDMITECRPMVRSDDIHDHRLRWIWEALCRLHDGSVRPDNVILCKDLDNHGQLSEIGGPPFLAQLLAGDFQSMNAPNYARLVAQDGTRRRVAAALGDIAKRLYDNTRDVTETLQFAAISIANADHGHSNRVDLSKRFDLFNASDALKPQPAVIWEVEKLAREASVSAVVGDPGCKKTWMLLDLAVCKAQGVKWLGLETRQSPVLIVDEESGHRRLNERLAKTLRGHFADADTPVWYVSLSQLDLRNKMDAAALLQLVEVTQAKLVIIDALIDVMPGAKENLAEETQPVFLALRAIANRTGAAIFVIHHNNKGGSYRGTTAIAGAVDLLLTVKSQPDKSLIEFCLEKARDIEPFLLAAEARFGDDQFYLVETEHPKLREEASRQEGIEASICEALEENAPSPMSTNKLWKCIGGNKTTFVNALEMLVKAKRVMRTQGPHGSNMHSVLP